MKKAIVLGATSGIGRELAKLLVANNYKVGITGRRKQNLVELQNENPESYVIKSFDIGELEILTQCLEELVSELGGLDLLVISSAIFESNDNLLFDVDRRLATVNVLGFTYVVNWAYNFFSNQQFGHLVAITSISGRRGTSKAPSYGASKAYQINYIEALRQKAYKEGKSIFLTDIQPGMIETDMNQIKNKFWLSSAEKTSKQILHAIEKKKKMVYVTKRWIIPGMIIRFIPDFIYNRMNV